MSLDSKPQTRKRGRPANASKSADASASQDRLDEHKADNEESTRSKQRGRPKKQIQGDVAKETIAQEDKLLKKRGRPATEDKNAEKTRQDAAQPKRGRGQSSLEKNQDEQELAQEATKNSVQGKRKRSRSSPEKNKDDNEPGQEAVDKEAQPKRKRDRAKNYQDGQEPERQVAENEVQPRRKRGRPSLENDQNERETEEEMVKSAAQVKTRRGRPLEKDQNEAVDDSVKPRRQTKTNEKQTEQPDEQDEESQPRKKGRKATQQPERPRVEPEDAEPAPRKKRQRKVLEPEPGEQEIGGKQENRRGPRNSSGNRKRNAHGKTLKVQNPNVGTSQEDAEEQQPGKDTKKGGRREGGKPSADSTNDLGQQQQQQGTNKKRRGSKDNAQTDSDEPPPSPQKPYLHIAPFKRTIRSSHITAKWSPLSGSSLPAATSILTLAQRPILQRTATTRNRRTHATAALNLVSRRIERKLARGLPFPPASSTTSTRRRADADGGRAMELDFEAVLDGKQVLDRELQPARHAVGLLKAEKDRMEKELEKDYEELRRLEANARAQTRERKDLFRKAHILAPTSRATIKHKDTEFVADKDEESLKDLVNTPLEPLALQLAGHVDSIRGNLQQAEGVTPHLGHTKAALQDVLQRYLDADAYEHVLLG
ncbi:hypothetical protein NW768_009169 [Fusarium equiseti]|uniref:Cylicin ii n=1 Tax=Fusarium equiseti TaxID=61235 RepID=A0ABQ8R4T2_FUSEQ|nr:hypothetical protein NW768_009169 [Fusarium equiseti]